MFLEAVTQKQILIEPDEVHGVRRAPSHTHSSVIALITMGLSNDRVARWMYPDPADYLSYFPGFIRAFGGRSFSSDSAYVTDDLSGAALWLPPGVDPDQATIRARLDSTIDRQKTDELFEVFDQMSAYRPKEDHWYLPLIAVDTKCQGKGFGTRLLQHAMDQRDDDGLPAYLETSNAKNIPLYERFGFVVMGTIRAGNSPAIFPMIRRQESKRYIEHG